MGDPRSSRVDERVQHRNGEREDGEGAQQLRDARLALTTLGFTKRQADEALRTAREQVKPGEGLEPLLRAALRTIR